MANKEHFMDKSTLLSVLLVLVGWFMWQSYMKKKYPTDSDNPTSSSVARPHSVSKSYAQTPQPPSIFKEAPGVKYPKEQTFSFKSPSLSFVLSSQGMGFKQITLNNILDREGQAVSLSNTQVNVRAFETRFLNKINAPIFFNIKRLSHTQFEGRAFVQNVRLKKHITISPQTFLVQTKLEVWGDFTHIAGMSTFLVPPPVRDVEAKSFFTSLFSPGSFLSFFMLSPLGVKRTPIVSDNIQEYVANSAIPNCHVVGFGTKYFGQAFVDKSDVSATFRFFSQEQNLLAVLEHPILNKQEKFTLSYRVFLGPKHLSLLNKHHKQLVDWVDFGWFGVLARMILKILNFFFVMVKNWGVSIILLTLLVRFLLLPLVLTSHRSMEVMKTLQPEIKKIREKFKKNPQRMNQEVMALMKTHRANPLGGCLPMLLQIPIFWALWKALSNSYSLYRSPFVFWIQDLSYKDPFYVLPALIGVLMFVQQELTPNTLSPEMARAMRILPIFIVFFMINLPSGLTLYVLVSSLFGIIQQMYLSKSSKTHIGAIKPVT